MTDRIRWNYDYYEEQGELDQEEEERQQKHNENVNSINEMKDKTSYFVSGTSEEEEEDSHFNDEDELNVLKGRYIDKQKQKNNEERNALYGTDEISDDSNEHSQILKDNLIYGNQNHGEEGGQQQQIEEQGPMDFLPDEKINSDLTKDSQRRSSLYDIEKDDANEPSRASQEEREDMYKSIISLTDENNNKDEVTDNNSLTECMNVKSLTDRFLEEKGTQESEKTLKSEASSKGFIGWGDNGDDSVYTNDNVSALDNSKDTRDSRSNMMLMMNTGSRTQKSMGTVIDENNPDDDVYEGFVSRENIRDNNNNATTIQINQDEELDSKRPWRKAPKRQSINSIPNNDDINDNKLSELKNDQSSTSMLHDSNYDKKTDSTLMADDFIDLESQCGFTSVDGSDIHLAQDCLTLYENMNHNSTNFFEQPHFKEMIQEGHDKDEEKKGGDEESVDHDVRWLHQLQPASTSNLSAKESGYYVTANFAKTKLGARLVNAKKSNPNDSDDNSMSSMVQNAQGSGGGGGWGKLRMFLQKDDSKTLSENNATKSKLSSMSSEKKSRIGAALIAAAKKYKEEEEAAAKAAAEEGNKDTYDSDSSVENAPNNEHGSHHHDSKNKTDTDDLSENSDPNLVAPYSNSNQAQSQSLTSISNDKYNIDNDDNNNHTSNKKSSSIKEKFIKHKNIIAIVFTVLLIGGIIGIVIIVTGNKGDENTGDKDPPKDDPIDVPITDKPQSLETDKPEPPETDKPEPPDVGIKWRSLYEVPDATGSSSMSDDDEAPNPNPNKSPWETSEKTQIEIPGKDECMVKVKSHVQEGVINIKSNSGDGVWKSYPSVFGADEQIDLYIESESISQGCLKVVVGVPTYDRYGANSGFARVFNVQPGKLEIVADLYGPKKPGYRTGEAVSMSNTGKVVAIGSPLADINGPSSGQVTIYELNTETGKWFIADTIEGNNEGDRLGTSVFVSHNGKRIVIGSPNYSFESNERCGKIQVLHKNEISNNWEPLGDYIMGDKTDAHMGKEVTMSGDGNRIFVNSDLHNVRVYQWGDPFDDSSDLTPTSWIFSGMIDGDSGQEVIDLTASLPGHRITVGYKDDSVKVYEFNIVNEDEEES